jgi:hypothetical protein
MARITNIGRANKIVYGTNAIFNFDVGFNSPAYNALNLTNPNYSYTSSGTSNPIVTNDPQAGTIVVAGTTVTLATSDIVSPQAVARKILATAISGWTVSINPYQSDLVTLQSTTVGSVSQPAVTLGTATGLIFFDQSFINGSPITIGAQDDIQLRGRTPVNLTLVWSGTGTPTVQVSYGTDLEQSQGTLLYQTALAFNPVTTGGINTITIPPNYIRVTTATGNTQVMLYIDR